jgi:lipid II:glycine glycyltransferase (peptidoglycan interpeptide bridge formation enzyme)
MPPFTQTMGPWFAPVADDMKYTSLLSHRQTLCKLFIEKLKQYPHFFQNFHCEVTDWLPFYWNGYKQTTRYTYLLNDLTEPDKIRENMSLHTRRNITKAKEKHQILVKKGIPTDEFISVRRKTFQRQGLSTRDETILASVIHKCREREQGDLWGGYDPEGRLHSAIFVAWQESSAYYLAGGGDPAYRSSGAHSLLMWEAIRFAAGRSEKFDFEGSMLPGVERFFREFGAVQTPYFTITRGNLSLIHKAWLKFKSLR